MHALPAFGIPTYPLQFICYSSSLPTPSTHVFVVSLSPHPRSSTLLFHDDGYRATKCWHLCSQVYQTSNSAQHSGNLQFIYCFTPSSVLFFTHCPESSTSQKINRLSQMQVSHFSPFLFPFPSLPFPLLPSWSDLDMACVCYFFGALKGL